MNAVGKIIPHLAATRPAWRLNASLIALLLTGVNHGARANQDLTELSLEQLMDVSIVSASRFSQKLSDVPSAVTVITRGDIQQYGWRTLAEAVRSVPGFFIHSDRTYDYVGARGFARPQDYNSRVLLLIDGQRTNDAVFDMAYVGTEQLIDIDLVDRIEVVRGPGSSVYGGNALFGVINIITRKASQIDGVELGAAYSSFNTIYGRATYGKRLDNGAEVLASVSGMNSKGPDLSFPEFNAPETNFGRTSGTAFDRNSRFYASLSQEGLSLTAAASQRQNGNPAALRATAGGGRGRRCRGLAQDRTRPEVEQRQCRRRATGRAVQGTRNARPPGKRRRRKRAAGGCRNGADARPRGTQRTARAKSRKCSRCPGAVSPFAKIPQEMRQHLSADNATSCSSSRP